MHSHLVLEGRKEKERANSAPARATELRVGVSVLRPHWSHWLGSWEFGGPACLQARDVRTIVLARSGKAGGGFHSWGSFCVPKMD